MNFIDTLISEADKALRTLNPPKQRTGTRVSPADVLKTEPKLTKEEKKHSAGLMRVNHSGEVCAQALYQGQALTAQLTHIKEQMLTAAEEETDHLSWCEIRLRELGSRTSLLNPIWYGGSFLLGALAGLIGDKVSLGFVAETERQVSRHLEKHIQALPTQDQKSNLILTQMKIDEERHAHHAIEAGGVELPYPVKQLMSLVSKIMTRSSYHL